MHIWTLSHQMNTLHYFYRDLQHSNDKSIPRDNYISYRGNTMGFLFAFLYYFCTFWVDGFFSFDRQFKNICILEMLALYTLPTVRSLHGGKHFWHYLPHGSVSVSGFVSGSVCGCDSVIKSGQFNNNKHRLRQSYIL